MDEDVGAKAPVTRLRRRLSVEQSEDVKSPSAPSTPSKKRGGRLAAKPQLELIDENEPENAPKRQTKKSIAKDIIEASEEKVLTPSRRSTRIKSNTSIVSDTPQGFDSPRAKRAARRNSQIGSDTEAPLTPGRQTRRTRKDSTSSIDKQENTSSAKNSTIVADSIIEEVETNSQKSIDSEKSEITPKRQSPRLQKKNKQGDTDNETENLRQKNNNTPDSNKKHKISDDSFSLIKSLDDKPVNKTLLNNSASSANTRKNKRNRTNTWASQNENNDSLEENKLEIRKNTSDDNNSGKNKDKHDLSRQKINEDIENEIKDSFNSSKSKKINSNSSDNSKLDKVLLDKSNTEKSNLNKTNVSENPKEVLNETEKLFEKPPVATVQSLIYFDDSDSDNKVKPISDKPGDNEDQCVPVVPEINQKLVHDSILNQNENASDKVSYNDTCEPMDIDETMPTNVSLINSSNSNQDKDTNEMIEKSKERKLNPGENIKSPNKSKREFTSSLSTSQNNDKTGNENKSTLILSQLKDVSTTDNSLTRSPKTNQLKDVSINDNSLTKSPKAAVEVLNKSVTNVNKNMSTDKTDSLTYMTSTPLQQKNLKKMAIQINTSVINNSNNESIQQSPTKKYKVSKQCNKPAEASSSEESDSENVSTKDKSDFLDDAAEEASDDYKSGDSQDEEEKQYAKENEILEKGETLDSDDEGSNDTDYEKDSFVVTSDEEDNELLSGSGEDLSMSDNELTMSKKSKKKFDERKSKAQKKASREMYEARHNISNNSSKSEIIKQKKNKRQRLNSSTLQSEEEIEVKSKKNRRMKIDSSQDSSAEEDPKETQTNVSMVKEQEITSVCDESILSKNDPLSVNVKTEPQTPLKNLDMSTVPILDKIEEVQMDQNVTVMKSNDTSDPLQEDSDASSISENMEISSNYDSVLKELNKEVEKRKINSLDMSLNLNKKIKQNAKNPIIDNLNLTNTKKSKYNTNKDKTPIDANTSQQFNSSLKRNTENKREIDESSSGSIDLQLLFSEDSSDSIKKLKCKRDNHNEPENFIPLKRTEAKTNIPEEKTEDLSNTPKNQDMNTSTNLYQGAPNTSSKKQKKKNSLSMSEDIDNVLVNPEVSLNSILNTSSKKKKKTSISNDENDLNISEKESIENTSMNTNIFNNSSKKKKNSISENDVTCGDIKSTINQPEEISQNQSVHDLSMNTTLNTSAKKKKKNSISISEQTSDAKDASNENNKNITQNDVNQSLNTSAKKKKKNNSISVSNSMESGTDADNAGNQVEQVIAQMDHNISLNNTLNTSTKKKHNISITEKTHDDTEDKTDKNEPKLNVSVNKDISMNTTLNTSSKKKKNSISTSEDMYDKNNISITNKVNDTSCNKSSLDMSVNSVLNTISKKKKKNSISSKLESESKELEVNNAESDFNYLNKSSNELTASSRKKKKHNNSIVADLNLASSTTIVDEKVNDSLSTSAKKKKKAKAEMQVIEKDSQDGDSDAPEEIPYTSHKNISAGDSSDGVQFFVDSEGNQDWNTLITSGSSKKKNKKKKELEETPSAVNEIIDTNSEETGKSKKRKRKSSANSTSQEVVTADLEQKLSNDSVYEENKRKKQKTSQSEDIPTNIKVTNKKQNKKRKERDDDDDPTITSKIFKKNSSDKVTVSRLPSTILNQLEDKPRKEVLEKKKAKIVSTTQFIVEEAKKRKNKPSNYLEESVYLNDSVDEKKQKGFIKIPKVLPFVPTATISGSGFTTKFQINVLAKETKFVAQTSNMAGFKNEYLSSKKLKKAGTYEMYKWQRNQKLSKF